MKIYSYLTTLLLAVFCLSSYAASLKDPELYFLSRTAKEPNCLWRIQEDMNSDTYPEIFITLDTYRNGKAGHMWNVFVGTKDGFVPSSEIISFRTDAMYIGYVNEVQETGLLSYIPASSSQGMLVIYQIKNNTLIEKNLEKIHPHGSDAKRYKKYFGSSKQSVEKKPIYGGKCSEF